MVGKELISLDIAFELQAAYSHKPVQEYFAANPFLCNISFFKKVLLVLKIQRKVNVPKF